MFTIEMTSPSSSYGKTLVEGMVNDHYAKVTINDDNHVIEMVVLDNEIAYVNDVRLLEEPIRQPVSMSDLNAINLAISTQIRTIGSRR